MEAMCRGKREMMKAWSQRYLDLVLELNAAYVERVTYDQFCRAVAEVPSEGAASLLENLCDIYVLNLLKHGAGWYLTHSWLPLSAVRAIEDRLVYRLLQVPTEDIQTVLDSFGFPQEVLSIPIADGLRWKTRIN